MKVQPKTEGLIWRFDCLASMAKRAQLLKDKKRVAEVRSLSERIVGNQKSSFLVSFSMLYPTLDGAIKFD